MVKYTKSYIMGLVRDFRKAIVIDEGAEIAAFCRERGIPYRDFTEFIARCNNGHEREEEYVEKMKAYVQKILG
jgi:hypothetical protein